MALIRRCARLLWMRTRLIKLNDKHKSRILNEIIPTNRSYVLQLHTQTRKNSQYESNSQSEKLTSDSHLETNTLHNPQTSPNPEKISGTCYADVKNIINNKLRRPPPNEQSFGLSLLESCRDMLPDADSNSRHELVLQAWDLLENLGQPLTTDHYNILLSIYAQNSQYLNAEEFLNSMKAAPDKDTYRLLLDAVAETGDHSQALKIMAKAKDSGYAINEAMFNSLILAYSINADIEGAETVLSTMQAARIEPSSATYCALSRGFATKGDLGNLERTLRTGNLSTRQLMSVVKSLSTSGHGEKISRVMKYLPSGTGVKNNVIIYAVVELTHLGRAKDALEIINCLPVPNTATDPTVGFADFFLHEMVKSETAMNVIFEVCKSLISSGKNPSALLKVTEAALRLKKEEMALLAFQALQNQNVEVRPHFYWPLLLNAALNRREIDVIRLVKHMIDNKVYLDDETLRKYTIPFLSSRDPLMVVRQLQDCGIKVSQLLTPLLATLLSRGNLKGAIALTDKLKGKIDKDVVIKHLLHAYIASKNANAIAELLRKISSSIEQNGKFLLDLAAYERVTVTNEELGSLVLAFDRNNLKISRSSAEALESRITRVKRPGGDLSGILERLTDSNTGATDGPAYEWIPHPRDMTIEELENHLADLMTKGMNTRGVLRRLIQAHCGKNNLKKAEKFAKIFGDNGFDWTTGMISGMFSLYAGQGMLEEAEIRYKELREKHKRFKIDDHKIIDYATVLVENSKLERALDVLKEQENVRCGPATSKNCWRLLNAVAVSGDSRNVKRTLDLLIKKGYCKISNHILGPLVRTHLSKGDLPAAVSQFKDCARVHKELPLQQELLRAIVQTCTDETEAQKQLAETLAVIKSIHGDAAANTQLFMALAATNKQKELHTFIKMPSVSQATMISSVQKLTDEKDLSALQTILKACRGLRKLDTAIIYDSILTLCSRSGDYETALQVWEQMQSEEVIPSQQFVEKLETLLRSQRVSSPPELVFSKGKRKG